MGEFSAYSILQAYPKVKIAVWPTSWQGHQALTNFHPDDPSELSYMALP